MYIIRLDKNINASVIPISNVNINNPELFMQSLKKKFPDVFLQAINAKYVANLDHVWAILRQSWTAHKKGISKVKFDLDIILRISCNSNLINALKTVGLHPGLQDVIFVIIGEKKYFQEMTKNLLDFGNYSEKLLECDSEKHAFLIKHHNINEIVFQSLLLKTSQLSAILAEKAAIKLA